MKIGYARVSTLEQNLNLQIDALQKAGCDKIFTDKVSGAKTDRKGLDAAIAYCRPGDTFMVWKLDRLGRNVRDLLAKLDLLYSHKIEFKSITDSIDTNTPIGKLFFHITACLTEFERDRLIERTKAGLEAARARGRLGGRPQKLDEKKINSMLELYNGKNHTVKEICSIFKIGHVTFYNYLHKKNLKEI